MKKSLVSSVISKQSLFEFLHSRKALESYLEGLLTKKESFQLEIEWCQNCDEDEVKRYASAILLAISNGEGWEETEDKYRKMFDLPLIGWDWYHNVYKPGIKTE